MESIYAALLLHKVGGKITEANLEKVLKAAGVEVEKSELTKLITGLKQTNIEEILKSAISAPAVAVTPTGGGTKSKPKKEEKKKEEEEEEEPTGIGSLF